MKRYFSISVEGNVVYLETKNCDRNSIIEFDVVNEAVRLGLITSEDGKEIYEKDIEEIDESLFIEMTHKK